MNQNIVTFMRDDRIYYNATISATGISAQPAIITDNRNVPFIITPDDWQVAVERFDVSSESIPFFTYDEVNNPMIITLNQLNGVQASISKTIAGPEVNNLTASNAYNPNGIYTVKQFLTMLNQTIYELCVEMNQTSAGTFPFITLNNMAGLYVNQPYFHWDQNTSKIIIYWPIGQYNNFVANSIDPLNTNAAPVLFTLGFNNALAVLFIGMFNGYYFGNLTSFGTYSYQFMPLSNLLNPVSLFGTNSSVTEWPVKNTIYQWSTVNKVYMSTDMPIRGESLPSTTGTETILTDFIAMIDENFTGFSRIQYFNQGNLKWIDLTGFSPLSSMNIIFKYQEYDGTTHTIDLFNGHNASFKLIFRPKKKIPT